VSLTAGGSGLAYRTKVDPSGSFTIPNVAQGLYRIEIAGLPSDVHVAELQDRQQALLPDAHISISSQVDLVINVESDAAILDATVTDVGSGRSQIILIPQGVNARALPYKRKAVDPSGHVEVVGITPGRYRVLVLEEIPTGAEQSLEFLAAYENRGTFVNLEKGQRLAVSVRRTQ
jgi:hypothetical protein